MLNQKNKHVSDVLDCIANLSNDEVFTSPKLANEMLDMLPQELFSNPRAKFLDPACKTGVFLREIVKRLDKGLEDIYPDRQQRIDHILHEQVYGIAITELTAQLSRRTVYCSKYACSMQPEIWISDDKDTEHGIHETHSYSISEFTEEDTKNGFCINPIQGNIRFNKKIKHEFDKDGTCKICGANKKSFGEYDHAYEFIHMNEEELEKLKNMQWTLIVGNPPYQLTTTEIEGKANAIPIYHKFVEQAKKLQPKYLSMIIPARWMTGGSHALDSFRDTMIHDTKISELHDFINCKDCFSGVDIKGGVCYFLYDYSHDGECNVFTHVDDDVKETKRYLASKDEDVFIRNNELASIKEKVADDLKKNGSVMNIASPQTPYGLLSNAFKTNPDTYLKEKENGSKYRVFGLGEKQKREIRYTCKEFELQKEFASDKYKVFVPEAYGCGAIGECPSTPILGTPILGTPMDICTQTFRQFGRFNSCDEAEIFLKYLKTKFFRALVGIVKNTQHAPAKVYCFVPLQSFTDKSDIDWSKSIDEIDKQLYKKYNLTDDEIQFIEDNIQEMK